MKHSLPPWVDYSHIENEVGLQEIKPCKLDHLYYILSLFVTLPSQNSGLIDEDGFLTLNSTLLQNYVHNYKDYIKFLIRLQIISEPLLNGYVVGVSSKRYKLNIPTGVHCLNPVQKNFESDVFKKKVLKSTKNIFPVSLSYLTKHLNDLDILDEEAIKFVERERIKKIKSGDWDYKLVGGRNSMEKKFKDPNIQTLSTISAIHKIKNKNIYASVDSFGRRLHTNLSNINKNIKPYLRYKGLPLGAIDIKNSQPFFCLKIFEVEFWKNNKGILIDRNMMKDIPLIIMLVESLKKDHNEELTKFRGLVLSGQLYEEFAAKLSKDGKIYSREEAKVGMLLILFSKNGYNAYEKIIFQKLFPQIYKIFFQIKKANHKVLSSILQRIESYIVIQVVCKKISDEFPFLPLFTIHDSIASPLDYLTIVKNVMLEEIKSYIKYEPTLSTEIWAGECR
jgi:hypothetical protein